MGSAPEGASYGYPVGAIFIFNLVVGTGALALPYGWNEAGLVNGLFFTLLVFFFAFMCVTFVIEAQSLVTAIVRLEKSKDKRPPASYGALQEFDGSDIDNSGGHTPLGDEDIVHSAEFEYFEDEGGRTAFYPQQVEMGAMSEVLLGKAGRYLFYGVLVLYLYGDLCIYAVAVPLSVRDTLTPDGITIGGVEISAMWCYEFYLLIYAVLAIPFCYFTFSNTKYLQYFTVVCRNVAFFLMFAIAFYYIFTGQGSDPSEMDYFVGTEIPALWGTIIYCFMCHHSIPGLISPLKQKRKLSWMMLAVYILLLAFYLTLCVSGLFAFSTQPTDADCSDDLCPIQSLYTENFLSFQGVVVSYFLGLYPVFTITSNYPLIAITLRNNMMQIAPFLKEGKWAKYRQVIFATVVAFPPFAVATVFLNVDALVSLTGAYAGLFIEFVIPAVLVLYARKRAAVLFPDEPNPYGSWFKHVAWIWAVLAVAAASLVVVTFNLGVEIYQAIADAGDSSSD